MIEWRDWGAFCADTLDTKPMIVGANCITLDEVAKEVMPLLSPYVPIITEDKVAFTAWVERALKEPINYQKKNCLKWSWEK